MEIQSALDEYTEAGSRSGYASKRENRTLKWVILALAILLSVFSIRLSLQKKEPALPDVQPISVVDTNSNPQQLALLGGELHLVRHSDGTYGILNDPIREMLGRNHFGGILLFGALIIFIIAKRRRNNY